MKRKLEVLNNAESTKDKNSEEAAGEFVPEKEEDENGEAIAGPSSKKKRKKTSPVWNHFTVKISEVDNKSEYAHCHYCEKKYVYAGSSNGGTGNLKNHLKSAHPERMPKITDEPTEEKFEFSQGNFREALVIWIIMSDQPFCECCNPYFLDMITSLNPQAGTISATTVKRDIMELFAEKVNEIKLKLTKAPGKLSFTLDAWTSKNVLPFMAIRAHWIDADWVYQTVLLDFCYITGKHDGENFCNIFVDCLKRFEIPISKVLSLTMDNVGSNDTFMEFLTTHGIKVGVHTSSAENRVRCMPHILNLSVQAILASLKIPLNHEEDQYEHLDAAELNGTIAKLADEWKEENDEENEEEDEHGQGVGSAVSTVSKLRKLIKKVRKSPQKRQKLDRLCQLYDIKYLAPIIDVATRLNSTFNMSERAAYLKVPLRALCSNEKSLKGLSMSECEWKELASLNGLLQKFDRSTKLLSMERHPSICSYIPTLNWLIESLESFIGENTGPLVIAARKGLEKLQKYKDYTEINNSKIPYVAMFLNPALKMSYFKEHNYTRPMIKEIQKSICEVFENNYGVGNNDKCVKQAEEESHDEFFNHMFKRAKTSREPKEFQKYLNFPLSSTKVDVIQYWQSQKEDFPNLSAMARDYLAVQSSSVAVERDFSMGVHLVTPTRCCLAPETIRACMCLKSWIKNQQCDSRP